MTSIASTSRLGQSQSSRRSMTALSAMLMAAGLCVLGIASFGGTSTDDRRYLERAVPNTRLPDGNQANPLRRLATVSNPPPASDIVPSEYIITVATGRRMPKAETTAASLLATYGGTLMANYQHVIKGFSAILTEVQAAAMALDASVVSMENNYMVYARGSAVPIEEHVRNLNTNNEEQEERRLSDMQAQTKQMLEETFMNDDHRNLAMWKWNDVADQSANWWLDRMSSRGARNGAYVWFHDGKNIDLYVLDTGIHTEHQEFSGRMQSGTTCTGGSADWTSTVHGTHIASLAGGATYGTGKKATLHPVQVLDMNGQGTLTSVLCGMEWTIGNHKASHGSLYDGSKSKAVAILGWGLMGQSAILDEAVGEMVNDGITVVIAAGNENADACSYSPYSSQAITVAAADDSLTGSHARSPFSNYGSCIDLFAPGSTITGASNVGTDGSVQAQGTSTAAGMAAGVATLYLSELSQEYPGDKKQGPQKVKEKMTRRAEPNVILDAGLGTTANLMTQTTSSMCRYSSQCPAGRKCRHDGTCGQI